MKKKSTIVIQPDKAEAAKSEPANYSVSVQKSYRDHHGFDHNHGRVNRHPFGSLQGPCPF